MSIHPALQRIKQVFDARYAPWDIVLPVEQMHDQPRGTLQQAGWTIHFHYICADEDAYLDYFASHRMTNDTLNRIDASGHEEVLGYCQEFYLADNPQAEQDYREHNRRFYEQVRAYGFL
jgi:hypothetical protein